MDSKFSFFGLIVKVCILFSFSTNCAAIDLSNTPESTNVIDTRGGIACKNPKNCVAGPHVCDTISCTQNYNTGLCRKEYVNGKIVPSNLCHTEIIKCPSTTLCHNMVFPSAPVSCQKLACPKAPPACIMQAISAIEYTGKCRILYKGPSQYTETCDIKEHSCNVKPQPVNTVTPRPTYSLTPFPTSTKTPRPTSTKTPRPTSTKTPRPTWTKTPFPTYYKPFGS